MYELASAASDMITHGLIVEQFSVLRPRICLTQHNLKRIESDSHVSGRSVWIYSARDDNVAPLSGIVVLQAW